MSGKTKAANRELSAILDDIEVALKSETANILCVGTLLLEAKRSKQVEHGDWLPLLKRRFDFSERTARNYMKAAKYAARVKSATIADLKIAPGVLYALADGRYDSAVEGQILKAAETERVDVGRVDEIYVALLPEQQEATSPDRWSETTIEPEPGDGGKCRDVGGGAQRRGPVRAAWHHRQIGER